VAARHPALVTRAVLIEPPMLWLTAAGTDAVSELREAVAKAARDEGSAGAVRAYLEAVGGSEVTALLGPERTEASLASPRAFAADLAAAASWTAGRKELRAIATPVVLLTGTRSARVRQDATRSLADLLPSPRLVELDSGHFAQLERPVEVAAVVAGPGV
jgi:pimeloyl-ACP methyl ester carboxylesterase